MTELGKTSVFEKITSVDYFSKKNGHANLPKINFATQESGREVNVIEAKITRSQAKKTAAATAATTPKKSSAVSKAISLAEKKVTPCFQKRMKFNLRVTPQASKKMDGDVNRNYKTADSDNFLSAVNCTYEIKDQNEPIGKSNFLELTNNNKTGGARHIQLDKFGNKNGPNIALNLNLALNMDSKDKDKLNKAISSENANHSIDSTAGNNTHINMEHPSSIKVAVRMRPLSNSEKSNEGSASNDILMKDDQVLIPHKKECFKFDHCLNSTDIELFNYASQEVVYRKMGEPLLNLAFQGYNTCLFAYGQSGSGKTYTMMGNNEVPGIIPRFINDLFKHVGTSRDIEFIVNISFMEIYNEKIHDLLSDEFSSFNKNLRVREHPQTGPYVEDLTVYTVDNYENAMELLYNGISRRSTASTQSNEQSSRSHSIFSIILVQNKKLENFEQGDSGAETSCISKIHLVDLAGSERANPSNNDRFREGTCINKSLLTLGKVIMQLADENGRTRHIPYRESALTYLLKDSLGGNSRTSMIATISPAKAHLEETVSTLRYASNTSKIVNIVRINEDPKMKIIDGLLKQISFLKKEVDKNKTDSFEHSDSEKDLLVQQQCTASCSKEIVKEIAKLDEKFKELLENQKSFQEYLENFKEETSKSKVYEIEVPEFKSKVVDELKSLIKSVKSENVIKDDFDYETLMKEIDSNAYLYEDDKSETKKVETEKKANEIDHVWNQGGKKDKLSKQQQKKLEEKKAAEAEEARKKIIDAEAEDMKKAAVAEEAKKKAETKMKAAEAEEAKKKAETRMKAAEAEEAKKIAEEAANEAKQEGCKGKQKNKQEVEQTIEDQSYDDKKSILEEEVDEATSKDKDEGAEDSSTEDKSCNKGKKGITLTKKQQKLLDKQNKKDKKRKNQENDEEEDNIPNNRDSDKKDNDKETTADESINEYMDALSEVKDDKAAEKEAETKSKKNDDDDWEGGRNGKKKKKGGKKGGR